MAQYVFTMNRVGKIVPPKRQILKNISLSFFPGAKIGLLGLNGAGKSTVLRIMAGVDTDFQGEARANPGTKVGYLEQEPNLDPAKTVREVVEEGVSAVAYLLLSQNEHGWTLEEAGDRDPAGARLGAMLQVLVAREPTHAPPLIRTWWPPAFAVPPQLEMTDRSAPRDVFMLRALTDVPLPADARDAFYWRSDYF